MGFLILQQLRADAYLPVVHSPFALHAPIHWAILGGCDPEEGVIKSRFITEVFVVGADGFLDPAAAARRRVPPRRRRAPPLHRRANMAHIRQPGPYFGLVLQVTALETFQGVPSPQVRMGFSILQQLRADAYLPVVGRWRAWRRDTPG